MESLSLQASDGGHERARRGRARVVPAARNTEVERLVERLDTLVDARAARLARARRLLITGQLDDRAVYLETARRMLGIADRPSGE